MKTFRFFTLSLCICLLFSFSNITAQEKATAEFHSDSWDIEAKKHEFTVYKGKPALYLENGRALLKNSNFKNGIIDYDVNFEQGRKFIGVHFRIQDPINYEEYYLRAHQSGNPDAMQYTPVFNGNAGWQLYYGEGHSTSYHYNFKEWIHIRLIIANDRMDVFINDMTQPVLHVNDLKMAAMAGGLGFGTQFGGAYFANLTVQSMDNPNLVSGIEELPEPENGTILQWKVSSPFDRSKLRSVNNLKDFALSKNADWKILATEYTGTLNLSRVSKVSKQTNTVLVKAVIVSEMNQIKRLDFGYSDVAILYVNDKIIYSGQRKFRSRDYRYLGTIGYFDAVFLNLKKGKNEITFAVTENFGGWGLKAKLENLEGVSLSH